MAKVIVDPGKKSKPIKLTLSTASGTGRAEFEPGSPGFNASDPTSIVIKKKTTIRIKGITESSTADNIVLKATLKSDATAQTLAQQPFSVVFVTLSFRTGDQETVSLDNAARPAYETETARTNLGIFQSHRNDQQWRIAVEIKGTVLPSDFAHPITLKREVEWKSYKGQQHDESRTLRCDDDERVCDTSVDQSRDDNPQSGGSGGKVYDIDAPAIKLKGGDAVGTVRRLRLNFKQWAVINFLTDNEIRVSGDDLEWFSRLSIRAKDDLSAELATDVANDNQAGVGTTNLTWNLQ